MNVQRFAGFLIKADQVCDRVPLFSGVNNLIDLFVKIVILPRMRPATIQANHYYSYLNGKTFTRSILLFIPLLGQIVVYLGDRLYDDKTYALEQLRKNGLTLQHMSKRLQNNKEVVLAATLNNPAALTYASEVLRNSKSFTCEVIKARKDDLVLKYTTQRPRNSRRVLFAAIEQNGLALQWAGDIPCNTPKVIRAAVLQNHFAFMHANSALRNNKEFVLELIAEDPRISRFLSKELQEDIEIRQALNKANAAHQTKWDDEVFVLAKVQENPFLLQKASTRLKGSKEFILGAIKAHIDSIREARRNGASSRQIKAWIFSHVVSRKVREDTAIQLAIQDAERLISL